MDPAVFGYIRVSKAEGESGLAARRGSSSGRRSGPATSSWSRGSTAWRGT